VPLPVDLNIFLCFTQQSVFEEIFHLTADNIYSRGREADTG